MNEPQHIPVCLQVDEGQDSGDSLVIGRGYRGRWDKAGIAGSPIRMVKVFFPKRERKSEMLQGSTEEQVEQLLEW